MKKIVTFGEILLRLATPGYLRFDQSSELKVCFGGSEANVAVSLANFGVASEFVTRLPKNDIAAACLKDLHKHGVTTQHTLTGGDRMGIYFLESGAVFRPSKVVYDRAHSAISQIEPGMIDWEEVFKDADWFHWSGITPAISQGARDACLEAIQVANRMGVTVSCDLNYRPNIWKNNPIKASDTVPELVAGCDIVMGNEEDAESIIPDKLVLTSTDEAGMIAEYKAMSDRLMTRFPRVKKVIITLCDSINSNRDIMGGLLYDGSQMIQSPYYDNTHIVDRVGAGDAFMGGLIYGLMHYPEDDQKALNFAVAASCLKHTIYGDYNEVSVEEVEKLMKGDASGRVSR